MEQRILGKSGVSVSRLCLGAMMFGDQTSEKNSEVFCVWDLTNSESLGIMILYSNDIESLII